MKCASFKPFRALLLRQLLIAGLISRSGFSANGLNNSNRKKRIQEHHYHVKPPAIVRKLFVLESRSVEPIRNERLVGVVVIFYY